MEETSGLAVNYADQITSEQMSALSWNRRLHCHDDDNEIRAIINQAGDDGISHRLTSESVRSSRFRRSLQIYFLGRRSIPGNDDPWKGEKQNATRSSSLQNKTPGKKETSFSFK